MDTCYCFFVTSSPFQPYNQASKSNSGQGEWLSNMKKLSSSLVASPLLRFCKISVAKKSVLLPPLKLSAETAHSVTDHVLHACGLSWLLQRNAALTGSQKKTQMPHYSSSVVLMWLLVVIHIKIVETMSKPINIVTLGCCLKQKCSGFSLEHTGNSILFGFRKFGGKMGNWSNIKHRASRGGFSPSSAGTRACNIHI